MDVENTLLFGEKEDLNELKSWLFREAIRLDIQKQEQEKMRLELEALQEKLAEREIRLGRDTQKFLIEREQFREEMNVLNQRATSERQMLRQETQFFEKKMEILRNGFAELEEDRKRFKEEKMRFEARKDIYPGHRSYYEKQVEVMFFGADTPLLLKKRYRDLVKIFHPDNTAGDHELFEKITGYYEYLQNEYRKNMQA